MKRFGIPELKRTIAMAQGVLDVLTVIGPAQVNVGTRRVKSKIRQRCAVANLVFSSKVAGLWGYFARGCLEQYDVQVWNVFCLGGTLIAHINNPRERFNREINSGVPTHPSMTM
ncbi:unnamed protein product [Phytophthora fragariaefolia]|uniref:Unnamed protein product n=1 Tax=Phytophthora fragariaefolia TaxID=1490495 RepID=A0A9W6XKA1_9STRA|nr:unnamed protein product [Phytophthora fragariaefolia]